jgi:hypothetical protein
MDMFYAYKQTDGPFPRNGYQTWRKAMAYEGAKQVGLMRRLFELRPWHKLVPDPALLAAKSAEDADHVRAARAEDGSFALAYLPTGKTVSIQMNKLTGKKIVASWYDPRDGTWRDAGEHANTGVREFAAPTPGAQSDWLLVLDDAAKGYPIR